MKENNGWIKLHRKIVDWEWYQDHKTFILFIHLLLTVNYEDKKWQGQVISRGSRITSLDTLFLELNKRPKHPTISIWDIRKSLDKLKSTNELTIKTNNKYTHISVNKFNEYQDDTNKLTNNSQTTHKQLTTTKEYKNIRNKEINRERLEEISVKYKVSLKSVEDIYEELTLYCKSSGKTYKDYEAALMNWIRRKIGEGKLKQTLSQEEELELQAKKLGLSIK